MLIELRKYSKGLPPTVPFLESRMQCQQTIKREQDNVVVSKQDALRVDYNIAVLSAL